MQLCQVKVGFLTFEYCTGLPRCQVRILRKITYGRLFVSPSVPFLSMMNIKPNVDGPSFDVVAVLDPLSQGSLLIRLFVCLFWFGFYQTTLLVNGQ